MATLIIETWEELTPAQKVYFEILQRQIDELNSKSGCVDLFELKFNPNHDRLGRFATGSVGPVNLLYRDLIAESLQREGLELDVKKLGQAQVAMDNLAASYPKTSESVAYMFYGKDDIADTSEHGMAGKNVLGFYVRDGNDHSDGKSVIMLDQRLIATDASLDARTHIFPPPFNSKVLRRAQTSGWHPLTKDPVSQVVNHEFGHHVAYVAQRASIKGATSEPWTNIRWASRGTRPGALSGYAKKDWQEAWAEGFSYVHEVGVDKMKKTKFTENVAKAIDSFDRVIEER